jgi:uncharacterized membrane protein YfcA
MTWQFVIAGLAVGTLVGMTGMGGGSLMTPMLILLFGFDPKTAVGTDILHGAVFKSFGAWRHRQLGNVHTHLARWMLVGSGPLSLVGGQLASSFSDSAESTMSKVVGASLILGGLGFAAKTFLPLAKRDDDDDFAITARVRVTAITIGAVFGFIVGLTSVGSGTFFGLALLLLFPLSATRMVGTDLLHGNVDTHAMAWLLVGSVPGVLIGSHLSIRVPDHALRSVFALVLVLSGIKLVKTPAADAIILVGVTAGTLALVAWAVVTLKARRVPAGDPA